MVYCQQCGATNDMMSEQCSRCGNAMPTGTAMAASSVGRTADAHGTAAPAESAPTLPAAGLAAGLELPEWLRRAAAETPEVEPSPARQFAPPPPIASGFPAQAETPLHRRTLNEASSHGQLGARQAPPPPSASIGITDTSSFIAEGDLPEWIRQIAAADAAKKVEEELAAAQAAAIAAANAPRATESLSLPGESNGVSASNPWLSRNEQAASAQAWSAPGTRSMGAPGGHRESAEDSRRGAVADAAVAPGAAVADSARPRKLTKPSRSLPSFSKSRRSSEQTSSPSSKGSMPAPRYLLMGAIAVALILAMVVMGM